MILTTSKHEAKEEDIEDLGVEEVHTTILTKNLNMNKPLKTTIAKFLTINTEGEEEAEAEVEVEAPEEEEEVDGGLIFMIEIIISKPLMRKTLNSFSDPRTSFLSNSINISSLKSSKIIPSLKNFFYISADCSGTTLQ